MLSYYLNQRAEYAPAMSTDDRGQPIYGITQSIYCRKQSKIKTAFGAEKQTTYEETVYYTDYPVRAGDKLDNNKIKAVATWIDMFGKVCGYKAVV